jgi:hypothetical protein
MSAVGLFAMGTFVTLIVGAALSLLVLGAVLDGRDQARRDAEPDAREPGPPVTPPSRIAVARRPAA